MYEMQTIKTEEKFQVPWDNNKLGFGQAHTQSLAVIESFEGVLIEDVVNGIGLRGRIDLAPYFKHELKFTVKDYDYKAFTLKNRFDYKNVFTVSGGWLLGREDIPEDLQTIWTFCMRYLNPIFESDIVLLVTKDDFKTPYFLFFQCHSKRILRMPLDFFELS